METPSVSDRLFTEFADLKEKLQLSDSSAARFGLATSETDATQTGPTRGLPEIENAIRTIYNLLQQCSTYVAIGLWLVQVLFTRQQRYKLLIAQVVVMLRERGFSEAETTVIKKLAKKELLRLEMSEDKAEWGSNQVVEILAKELPPQDQKDDNLAIPEMVGRIRELIAFFPGWQFQEKEYGCRVQVPLQNNRHHSVHVISKGKDKAGRLLVEFQAVCGKVESDSLEHVLRKSGQLQFGNFSIRTIEGTDHFVLQHRIRVEEVTQSAINRILPYLADSADKLGADVGSKQPTSHS